MRIHGFFFVAVLGIALGGAARADDTVYFTNGTAMSVRSHQIDKGMIRVDLGNNAVMAFPVAQVERVESNGRKIFPNATGPANQAIATGGTTGVSFDPNSVQTGHANVPAQYRQSASARRRAEMSPEDQLRQSQQEKPGQPGVPAGMNTAAKRNLRLMGAGQQVMNEDGTFKRGNVSVINMPGAPVGPRTGENTPPIVSLGPKTDVEPEPVPPEAADESGTDSGGGAEAPPER